MKQWKLACAAIPVDIWYINMLDVSIQVWINCSHKGTIPTTMVNYTLLFLQWATVLYCSHWTGQHSRPHAVWAKFWSVHQHDEKQTWVHSTRQMLPLLSGPVLCKQKALNIAIIAHSTQSGLFCVDILHNTVGFWTELYSRAPSVCTFQNNPSYFCPMNHWLSWKELMLEMLACRFFTTYSNHATCNWVKYLQMRKM